MNPVSRSLLSSRTFLRTFISFSPVFSPFVANSGVFRILTRGFAGGDKKKGKKQNAAAEAPKVSSDSKIPINIFSGGKDPEVLPADQYPEWLWHMLDSKVTADEWETREYKGMGDLDMRDMLRVKAARRIKEFNMSKAK